MRSIIFFLVLIIGGQLRAQDLAGQYSVVDTQAGAIPDSSAHTAYSLAGYISRHFSTDEDRARALFIWIGGHIAYNTGGRQLKEAGNSATEQVNNTLKSREGVCEDFALLFYQVCVAMHIPVFLVEGYTRQEAVPDLGAHVWCAAKCTGTWGLYDPTWGAGYQTAGKYVRKTNNSYFNASPELLIKSHYPYDPIWQLLPSPLTRIEWLNTRPAPDSIHHYRPYQDSVNLFATLSPIEQLEVSARRITANMANDNMTIAKVKQLKASIRNYRRNESVDLLNDASTTCSEAIMALNDFMSCRNNQTMSEKTKTLLQEMMGVAIAKRKDAGRNLNLIRQNEYADAALRSELEQALSQLTRDLHEQQEWLKTTLNLAKENAAKLALSGHPNAERR